MNFRESDEHGRIAGVVVRNAERRRIGLHEKLALVEINFDNERIAVFPQPAQKFAFDAKRRRAVSKVTAGVLLLRLGVRDMLNYRKIIVPIQPSSRMSF